MNKPLQTPVLMIIFNRPEKVKTLIKSLSLVKPGHIYISADGPREGVLPDIEKCNAARNAIKEINWPCEIHTNFLDHNLGVDAGMEEAMNWFFSNVTEGIICEDDCIPHPDFFTYCATLLERYRHEERIMLISGSNFQDNIIRGNASYYYSNYPTWGYAMWKRTWDKFDSDLDGLSEFIGTKKINQILEDPIQKKFWINLFTKIRNKKYRFTDSRLLFSIWNNNGVIIIPNNNLIQNIGFDADGTHTTIDDLDHSIEATTLGLMKFDDTIKINREADDYFYNKMLRIPLYKKIYNSILKIIK